MNVSMLGFKSHLPGSKLVGLEVWQEKKVTPFLKSVVSHPPTAKVHHLSQVPSGFSGLSFLEP